MIIWGCYFALALAGTAWSIFMLTCVEDVDYDSIGVLSGIQVTLGLLLVSIMRHRARRGTLARKSRRAHDNAAHDRSDSPGKVAKPTGSCRRWRSYPLLKACHRLRRARAS